MFSQIKVFFFFLENGSLFQAIKRQYEHQFICTRPPTPGKMTPTNDRFQLYIRMKCSRININRQHEDVNKN